MSNFNNCLPLFITITVLSMFFCAEAQESEIGPEMPETMRPSKSLVIVVLCIMFGITFCLLAYVKCCRVNSSDFLIREHVPQNFPGIITRSSSRYSGIDKQVIESLPFFRFSSLKGSKEGLECCVCLSKFEETEILRLLPKCKHAFHINCIDMWLEKHSSCPLCRLKVDPADIKSFAYSISSRFLRVPSNLADEQHLEIFVQREEQQQQQQQPNQEGAVRIDHGNSGVHKFNHKIVISDVVTRSRWSDLNSSDLLSLNSEMINVMSRGRFDSTSNEEENSFTLLNPVGEKRSMSDIANVPRFAEISRMKEIGAFGGGNNGKEERLRRIWLQIARRTVQWFAGRETCSVELQHKPLGSHV